MTEKQLDQTEARQILENLARNGPPTAQVAALRALREFERAAKAEEEAEREANAIPPGFEGL